MKTVRIREGEIKRVYLKELTQEEIDRVIVPKVGDKIGQQIKINDGKTHKLSLEVEYSDRATKETVCSWFSCSPVKLFAGKPQVWKRTPDKGKTWEVVNPSAIVDFNAVDKEDGFNPKINLNTFDLIENGPEQEDPFIWKRDEGGGEEKPKKKWTPKDTSGIQVGHSLNCGLIHNKHKLDVTKVLKASKNAHDITVELQGEYKEQNPNMSEYDRNAAVGHSILNSFRIGGSKLTLLNNARIILNDLVPPMLAYVKGETEEEEEKVENKKEDTLPFDDDVPY